MNLGVDRVSAAVIAIDPHRSHLDMDVDVDTMDGPELHAAGLACIRTAFGFVMTAKNAMRLEALTAPRNELSPDRRSVFA